MKYTILFIILVYAQIGTAQKTSTNMNNNLTVPLIEREIFFDNPEIAGGQISPDARWISFTKPLDGVMNIWVKAIDEDFEKARPLTAESKRPISSYFWSYDSKHILFVKDNDGDENYLVYAVDPMAAPVPGRKVPESRCITPAKNARAYIFMVSKINPDIMYVGLNDRDQAWHDLYQLNIATGERKLILENKDRITGLDFDWDENLRLASRSNDDGTAEILRVDKDGFHSIYKTDIFETAYILAFDKDNKMAYMVTNKGDENDLSRLVRFDPINGREKLIEQDPLGKADFGSGFISDISREILYTSYTDAKTRRYFNDKSFEKFYNQLKDLFPGKEIGLNSTDRTESKWLISVSSDNDPGAVYFVDRSDMKPVFQYRPRPKLNPDHLAKMEPISFRSSDGLEIPAYLTLPVGVDANNLPSIVMPHGGPWARDYWGYNSYAQFLANRGYAVLLINFRGSTGFGKSFLNAGNGEWGQLMQDDITWGVQYLIEKGIADKERIGIIGGSYGGYATLAGVTFTPDLYKAGVSIVGPSNLITLLNSIPPYWEAFRKTMYSRMADLNTPEGRALLEKQSPLNSVHRIKTPLLVVQGANDPRVKKAESDQIVIAMRDKHLPVEYLCADDEGHGFARPVNNMAFLAKTEEFFAKHLGGRYQSSMSDEVKQRLQEITVDINSLKMPDFVDNTTFKKAIPLGLPKAGTYQYKSNIAFGGQDIALDFKRKVELNNEKIIVKDEIQSPMGMMEDELTVDLKSFRPVSRHISQGPMNIQISSNERMLDVLIKLGAQDQKMSLEMNDNFLTDHEVIIGLLPFEEGYTASYSNVNMQSMISGEQILKVTGKDKLNVSGKDFDTWRVEISEPDGSNKQTLWYADGLLIRKEATMAQMAGAKMTMELRMN